jgi:hypothetical protein
MQQETKRNVGLVLGRRQDIVASELVIVTLVLKVLEAIMMSALGRRY